MGRGLRHRLARCWLYERLTGLPAGRSVWGDDSSGFRSKLADLPLWLTAELHAAVDEYARKFLASRGIHDEPVQSSPCATCASTVALPALQPPCLDMAEVHRVIRTERPRSLVGLVRTYDCDLDLPRYLLESQPVSFDPLGQAHSVGRAIHTAARGMPRERFIELYLVRRQSLAQIARGAGVSRQTLTRLAGVFGVPLRRPGRPATIGTDRA